MRLTLRLLRGLFYVLVIFVITVALDVVLTRYVWPESIMQRIDRERFHRVYSPIYHHGLLPNRRVYRAQWSDRPYAFSTNSLGFKDYEVRDVPSASEATRLVMVGDSFTEGAGFAFSQTFSGRLDSSLREQGIEVFNAGVVSYSPAIYYRRIKHLIDEQGFQFDELVVFLDISDIYEEANSVRLDEHDRVIDRELGPTGYRLRVASEAVRTFLKQSSLMYRFISELNRQRKSSVTRKNTPTIRCLDALAVVDGDVRRVRQGVVLERLMTPGSSWTFDEDIFQQWGERGLQTAATNLGRLHDLAQEHEISMTLVVYPWPAQIFRRDLDSRQVSFWRSWADSRGVPFLNLFPAFIDGSDPLETYASYFIPCDVHWNAAGHEYVAQKFLDFYQRQAELGSE